MNRRGWVVTLAGMGLNLALGILYAWSVFSKQLVETVDKGGFGWTKTQATLPYTVAIAVFGVMMIPAGRLQDKFGPRIVASAGGILTGVGLIVASLATPESVVAAMIGFGLLAGTGFGLGYSATTPGRGEVVPAREEGAHHRPRRRRLRDRAGLHRAALEAPARHLRDPDVVPDPRRRVPRHRDRLRPVHQEPREARRLAEAARARARP